MALVAAFAQGWVMPAVVGLGEPSDLDYFSDRRERLLAALEAAGRDATTFDIAAQIPTRTTADDRRWAVEQGIDAVRRGATHVIFGMPPRLGPDGVDRVAVEVAGPLRDALGR